MPTVSPQAQAQALYQQLAQLFSQTVDDVANQALQIVSKAPNLQMANRDLNALLDRAQYTLDEAYKAMLVDANIDVRKLHHPQKELDPYTRTLVNEFQAQINQSANAAHPMRQFDGASVNPASRPQDSKPGDVLTTAQDLKRAQSDNEFANDLKLRLQAKLSMPGPRPSAPRPDRNM